LDLLEAKLFRTDFENLDIVFDHIYTGDYDVSIPILKVRAVPLGEIHSSERIGQVEYREYTDESE